MFTLICRQGGRWIDADTGEDISLPQVMETMHGGVICGFELHTPIAEAYKSLDGWRLYKPGRKNEDQKILRHYWYRASKRLQGTGNVISKRRTVTKKWVIWNFELFHNDQSESVVTAAKRLRDMLEERGVKPTATPGGMGKAMLKASSEWSDGRYFAPPWISEIAREHLPGNFYALRDGFRKDRGIILIDQQAAHHNIVNSTPIPHPQSIHRRGRRVPTSKDGRWLDTGKLLRTHMGLVLAKLEIDTIPPQCSHLYPTWAQTGTHLQWVWTPELRLLDQRIRLVGIQSAFTGDKIDTALWEYSDFALDQLSLDKQPVIKPVLHAAYGTLGVNRFKEYKEIIVGDPGNHKHKVPISIKDIDSPAHEVTISGMGIAAVQNVVAYGVITAEQTTRSLELARQFEWEYHVHVVQVYADALLVRADQIPFTPPGWEVKGDLGEVVAGRVNEILATRIQRIPGLRGERKRAIYLEQVRKDAA